MEIKEITNILNKDKIQLYKEIDLDISIKFIFKSKFVKHCVMRLPVKNCNEPNKPPL